jgi:hypothetical protein
MHKYYFSYQLAVRPLKRFAPLQCGPRGRRPARAAQFRRGPAAGTGAGWPRGAPGPIWEGGPGGKAAGDGRRRRAQVAAAGDLAPSRLRPGRKGGAAQ